MFTNSYKKLSFFSITIVIAVFQGALAQPSTLLFTDFKQVNAIKNAASVNKDIQQQMVLLQKSADDILTKKILSVVDKQFTTPCGNPHEYMSLARYYWPDTTKTDGLPYIRKDGQANPDNDKISDYKSIDDLIKYVTTLSWAYYFTNQEKYASKAVSFLRFWCIDTATKMLPNLNHAQIIKGIDTGRGIGIIDIHLIPFMLDGITMLQSSAALSSSDATQIRKWFDDLLVWLQTSENGQQECKTKNNHKTYYETLVASLALFCNKPTIAKQICNNAKTLIAAQFEPDGRLLLELERTNAFSYTSFCLKAWCMLAAIAEKVNVDLWNYETNDGKSIAKGFDYIMPFALSEKKWEYQQIGAVNLKDLSEALMFTNKKINITAYNNNYQKFSEKLTPLQNLLSHSF